VKPSRYDDEGRNVGDENVDVKLENVRHDAGGFIADGIGLQPGAGESAGFSKTIAAASLP
jgi:hypothetical protein